jgi:hypothetical protein
MKAEFIISDQIENGLREEECACIERSTAPRSFSMWWAVTPLFFSFTAKVEIKRG